MNILYITPTNPLDNSSGASVRSAALWGALKLFGNVRTVVVQCSATAKLEPVGGESEANISLVGFRSVYNGRLPWSLFVCLSCIMQRLNWGFPDSRQIRDILEIPDVSYDIIVVRYLWIACKFALWKIGPCYIDVDDSPKARFETCVAPMYGNIKRIFARWMYLTWQKLIARHSLGVWFSCWNDANDIMEYNKNAVYLPNVSAQPDLSSYKISLQSDYILIVGWMGYEPNYQGTDRFLNVEWPLIRDKYPFIKVKIVGREAPEDFAKRWESIPGVELLGYVDDLSCLYASCCAVVTPIWAGGGTSVKVIEAVKYGCKVLATPIAVRGLRDEQIRYMRIVVVSKAGGFVEVLEKWVEKPTAERIAERKSILDVANDFNRVEDFQKAVKTLIVGDGNV